MTDILARPRLDNSWDLEARTQKGGKFLFEVHVRATPMDVPIGNTALGAIIQAAEDNGLTVTKEQPHTNGTMQ